MNLQIVQRAIELAGDREIMKSYEDFYQGKGYFLTKNQSLDSAKWKPESFPGKKGIRSFMRDQCHPAQSAYLAAKAGVDPKDVQEWDYSALLGAYEKWKDGYFSVYFGPAARWACNLFVGETLFLAGHKMMKDRKYYSARQIWNAEGGFRLLDKKNVTPGCIAAFGGHHLEIVTKVSRNQTFSDDDFCSRGAGRGSSDFGTERCENNFDPFGTSREIYDNNIRFLTI